VIGARVHRLLLRLLPAHRRAQYGAEMTSVFADLCAVARREKGHLAVAALWVKEIAGVLKFAVREWIGPGAADPSPRLSPPYVGTELRWAWRGLRVRGWRAVFIVLLLGVTLGASAVVFAVVDSLVFRPQPYPDVDRLVMLTGAVKAGERMGRLQSAALYGQWRAQHDLFAAVGGFLTKTVFVAGWDGSEQISTADITVDMLDVLGVKPIWGRGFTDADLASGDGYAALVREDLARERFGSAAAAVGQRLDATGGPLLIVGVMPSSFAFPNVRYRIWRALNPAGPLTTNFGGVFLRARVASGISMDALPARLAERAPLVGRAVGLNTYTAAAGPFTRGAQTDAERAIPIVVLGAAMCLLLATVANVIGLELAHVIRCSHTRAIQMALGASRASLGRVAALEAAALAAGAFAIGLPFTWMAIRVAATHLLAALPLNTGNPIDLDGRALAFIATISAAIWLLMTVVPLASAARVPSGSFLAFGERAATSAPRSAALRRWLTGLEVALAVVLLVVGVLYVRTSRALARVDKGFNSHGLAQVELTTPAYYFASPVERTAFGDRLMRAIAAVPGVQGTTFSAAPPAMGDSPTLTDVEIDGRPGGTVGLGRKPVDLSYFSVIGLPLVSGRYLATGDSPTDVVVSASFARRFWPRRDAVGHSFRGTANGPFANRYTVVGVVGDFRTDPRRMPDERDDRLYMYVLQSAVAAGAPSREPPPGVIRPTPVDTGGSYGLVWVTVRMDSPTRGAAVLAAARALDPRLPASIEFVDDRYADENAATRIVMQVVDVFSVIAFLVAMAGLYGVMAFFVASRTREIGVRVALGADRRAIRRLVLGSSGRIAVAGAIAGAALAYGLARLIASQLFGVSPDDPLTYVTVLAAVVLTALAATWHPARQAARVDPAITLRAE
jgi:predicted permease